MTPRFLTACVLIAALLLPLARTVVGQSVGGPQMQAATSGNSPLQTVRGNQSGAATNAGYSGLTAVPPDFTKLKLAPGFMVSLSVLDDPDFAGAFRIDDDGDIALPILGSMHLAGETVTEARLLIHDKLLKEQILKDPQVTLTVVEYSAPEVTVIGEVNAPGKYPLLVPRKLVDVLALAGGTTIAAGNEVQITRSGLVATPILIHYSRNTNAQIVERAMVHPGDTVQVLRAGIVYVLGAVTRPGGYVMQEEGTLNVLQAVSLAWGTSPLASLRTIYLLHRNTDGAVVYIALPYKKMTHGEAANVQLHATDILYVPTSALKTFYTDTQSLLNAAAIASIYVAAGY